MSRKINVKVRVWGFKVTVIVPETLQGINRYNIEQKPNGKISLASSKRNVLELLGFVGRIV
jgi:hypothetical protein